MAVLTIFLFAESQRDDFDAGMLAVNDYIKRTCDGKSSCFLEIPNWTAVNGTAAECAKWFPGEIFHLRGVYLDIGCSLRK